jgi:hypothetical protein
MVALLVGGCSLNQDDSAPTPLPTAAPSVSLPTPTLIETAIPTVMTAPVMEAFTGVFGNAAALLDGVCFEFLLTLNGQTWAWTTPADLSAFYDRADASTLCPDPVARYGFDFSQTVLVGVVNAAEGCDAAYRVLDLVQDDSARAQTLIVQFDTLAGCPYELVEPLLVAIPRPPDGYTLQVAVRTP